MIYSSPFEQHIETTLTDFNFQIKGHGAISIINMMYLPRVNAKTQIKNESLKPRENTIKAKQRESGTSYAGCEATNM